MDIQKVTEQIIQNVIGVVDDKSIDTIKEYIQEVETQESLNALTDVRNIHIKDNVTRYFKILTRTDKSMDLIAKNISDDAIFIPPYPNCLVTFEQPIDMPEIHIKIDMVHAFRMSKNNEDLFPIDVKFEVVVDDKVQKGSKYKLTMKEIMKRTSYIPVQFIVSTEINGDVGYSRFFMFGQNTVVWTDQGWYTMKIGEIPQKSDFSYIWSLMFFMMFILKHPIEIKKLVGKEIKKIKELRALKEKRKDPFYNRAKPAKWRKKHHERVIVDSQPNPDPRDYTRPDFSFDRAAHYRHYFYCPHKNCGKRILKSLRDEPTCLHCLQEVINFKVVKKFIDTHTMYKENQEKHNKNVEYEE